MTKISKENVKCSKKVKTEQKKIFKYVYTNKIINFHKVKKQKLNSS